MKRTRGGIIIQVYIPPNLQDVYARNLQDVYARNLQDVYVQNLQDVYARNLQDLYARGRNVHNPLLYFLLLLLLSINLLAPEDDSLSKAPVYYCFLLFHRIGEFISLDVFYFVNLTSSCSLIPQKNKTNINNNTQQKQGKTKEDRRKNLLVYMV